MSTESEESLLAQLEHLVLDEDRLISAKWLSSHMEVHVQLARKLLSQMVAKHAAALSIHHCLTGYKQDPQHAHKVFCIEMVTNHELASRSAAFAELISTEVYSVSKTRNEQHFAQALYREDYQQTHSVISNFLQQQQLGQPSSPDELSRFSMIRNGDISTVPPPTLHKALAPDVAETKQNSNSNSNSNSNQPKPKPKASTFEAKVSALQQAKPRMSPLKHKLDAMNMGVKKVAKQAKQGIDSMFAKQAKQQPSKKANKEEPKAAADPDTEMQDKGKEKATDKKESKKKHKKKKAKKIKAAKKRKRGDSDSKPKVTSNLAPIDYDSESSESERNDEATERAIAENDAELEAVKSPSKRRKIIADSDDDDQPAAPIANDGDEDSDMDMRMEDKAEEETEEDKQKKREAAKAQKAKEKELAKQRKEAEKARLLAQRKKGFFGAATGNDKRRKGVKKYKTVRKSYINGKGMFVTEDVRVTDDEADEAGDKVEVTGHKGQVMEEDDDTVMTNKENSAEQQNAQKKQEKGKKPAAKAKRVGKSPKPKKGKSGNIMNFFKAK